MVQGEVPAEDREEDIIPLITITTIITITIIAVGTDGFDRVASFAFDSGLLSSTLW